VSPRKRRQEIESLNAGQLLEQRHSEPRTIANAVQRVRIDVEGIDR
jgi:hypothetical protein